MDVVALQSEDRRLTGFLGRGLWGRPAAALLNPGGHLRWSDEGTEFTPAIRPGFVSIGLEGALAIVVRYKPEGLLLVDPDTRQVKSRIPTGEVWDLATVDLTGDGQNEIITLNHQATIAVWAAEGVKRASKELAFDHSELTILRGGGVGLKLALSSPSAIHLLDVNLNPVLVIKVPLPKAFRLKAAAVTKSGEGEFCLVSLFRGRGGWHRTLLFVHSLKGDLLWHEILGDDFQSVMPHPDQLPAGWGFLIGGRGEVREYRRSRA